MKKIIAIEEMGMFLLAVFAFSKLSFHWWVFPALLLVPDLSMLGYLAGPKVGAWFYNVFHHKTIAIVIFLMGFYYQLPILQLSGIVLFAHSCMDRALGYGLKYSDAFNHTHLGLIGKNK
ncbi:hypothetical protein HDC90_001182 [Pedobacter sp. AK013]|uniref:DUF4260 domain-containing protein n=1 Tax=Pedobacter sp. AK013 TaxID=2723071 RepID=UPI001617F584|nr:DUF4260 domain-containing protein [Pedobacter sp. AK013]MBB6236570.1 hypothetical protein [Pedobacter sp. AK013]